MLHWSFQHKPTNNCKKRMNLICKIPKDWTFLVGRQNSSGCSFMFICSSPFAFTFFINSFTFTRSCQNRNLEVPLHHRYHRESRRPIRTQRPLFFFFFFLNTFPLFLQWRLMGFRRLSLRLSFFFLLCLRAAIAMASTTLGWIEGNKEVGIVIGLMRITFIGEIKRNTLICRGS